MQQTIITQWSCYRRTVIIFFQTCKKRTAVPLLEDFCSCLSKVFSFVIFSLTTTRLYASPHIIWLAHRLTLVKKTMTKLLCSFLVVPLTSLNRIDTNLLGDPAIWRNRFELIVILAILFLKCVATNNFSWNTRKLSSIFGVLSWRNCPDNIPGASSPLTLRESFSFSLLSSRRKQTWNMHAKEIWRQGKECTTSARNFKARCWPKLNSTI